MQLSASEQLKCTLKVDFYQPVLNSLIVSLNPRCNAESLTIINHILPLVKTNENFYDVVEELSQIAKMDSELWFGRQNDVP